MFAGYSVKVGMEQLSGEPADHFVAYEARRVANRDQITPYCLRSPVGPDMRTLPHTEYAGFGETPNEALTVAVDTCRRDWPGIGIVHESTLDLKKCIVAH
jgi:hypothetical protein